MSYSKKIAPTHPGEILDEEFLKPLNITKYRLAKDIHVPAQRVGDIVNGKRAINVAPSCIPTTRPHKPKKLSKACAGRTPQNQI